MPELRTLHLGQQTPTRLTVSGDEVVEVCRAAVRVETVVYAERG